MSNSQSIKIWGGLALVLVLFGLVWAVWPVITGAGLFDSSLPAPVEPIATPAFLEGLFGEEISPLLATAVLAVLAVVLIGGAGAALGVAYTFISRLVSTTMDSEEYRQKASALEQKEKETLKNLQEGRKSPAKPDHSKPGWSAASTTLIVISFAASLGLIVSRTFYPEVFIERANGTLFSPGVVITGVLALVGLLAGLIWIRPRRIATVDETDFQGIPWDSIIVIVTGLLIVGVGLAIAVWINQPV